MAQEITCDSLLAKTSATLMSIPRAILRSDVPFVIRAKPQLQSSSLARLGEPVPISATNASRCAIWLSNKIQKIQNSPLPIFIDPPFHRRCGGHILQPGNLPSARASLAALQLSRAASRRSASKGLLRAMPAGAGERTIQKRDMHARSGVVPRESALAGGVLENDIPPYAGARVRLLFPAGRRRQLLHRHIGK
jgi:hypothetical protein